MTVPMAGSARRGTHSYAPGAGKARSKVKSADAERLLRDEIAVVTGCTEPAAIAHAVQCARKYLEGLFTPGAVRVALELSPEVLRNASTAVVPVLNRRGIRAAAAAGLLSTSRGFNPFARLKAPPAHLLLSRRAWLTVVPSARRGIYIKAALHAPGETVTVVVAGRHDYIASVERNGEVLYRGPRQDAPRIRGLDEIAEIVRRRSPRLERIALDFITRQVKADPSKTIPDGVAELVAKRMTGSPLPVVTVTGSGNQGIFLGVPLRALYRRIGRRALPAALFSLLAQAYLSRRRKRISEECGLAAKAAPALAAGLAYARGGGTPAVRRAVAGVYDLLKGMPCRGAEPGCGTKAARALRCVFSVAGNPVAVEPGSRLPAAPPEPSGAGKSASRFSRAEIERNHARLMERNDLFRRHGYDFEKGIRFVLRAAGPLSGKILEIGTGKGRFLIALAAVASSVTTVDIDPAEQRYARMNAARAGVGRRIRFSVRDAGRLKFRAGSFDAVVSMNALHHFRDPLAVMHELVRVLKPGGRIVLGDLDRSGYRIFERVFASEGRTHTRFRYGIKDLAACLRSHGMRTRLYRGHHQELLIAERRCP